MVPLFVAALLIVRGLPALLYRRLVGTRHAAVAGLLQATSLPFIVTTTAIGLELGVLDAATGAALVAAGLLSVLIFPVTGLALLRSADSRNADEERRDCGSMPIPAAIQSSSTTRPTTRRRAMTTCAPWCSTPPSSARPSPVIPTACWRSRAASSSASASRSTRCASSTTPSRRRVARHDQSTATTPTTSRGSTASSSSRPTSSSSPARSGWATRAPRPVRSSSGCTHTPARSTRPGSGPTTARSAAR